MHIMIVFVCEAGTQHSEHSWTWGYWAKVRKDTEHVYDTDVHIHMHISTIQWYFSRQVNGLAYTCDLPMHTHTHTHACTPTRARTLRKLRGEKEHHSSQTLVHTVAHELEQAQVFSKKREKNKIFLSLCVLVFLYFSRNNHAHGKQHEAMLNHNNTKLSSADTNSSYTMHCIFNT